MRNALVPRRRTRHVLATLLVGLLAGGLGMVTAADPEQVPPPDLWAAPFSIPLPAVADHGRYVHVDGTDTRDVDYWPDEVEFEWLEDGAAFAEDGATVRTNRLWLRWGDRETRTWALEPGTASAYPEGRSEAWSGPEGSPLPVGGGGPASENETSVYFGPPRPASLWCGIRHALQGQSLRLAEPVTLDDDCWNSAYGIGIPYGAVSVGMSDEGRIIVVDVLLDRGLGPNDGRPTVAGSIRTFYREGLAYPYRVEFGRRSDDVSFSAAYELQGLSPGSHPISVVPEVLKPAPPRVDVAPVTGSGPVDEGVDVPWLLSDAWEEARHDLSFVELQAYLQQHPQAYIGQATVLVSSFPGQRTYEWYIVLSDGTAQFGLDASRTFLELPGQTLAAPSTFKRLNGGGWEDGPYPAPTERPTSLPVVASAFAVWPALTWSDQLPNSYGFDLRCGNALPCTHPHVWIGYVENACTSYDSVTGSCSRVSETLRFGVDGSLRSFTERRQYDPSDLESGPNSPPEPLAAAKEAAPLEAPSFVLFGPSAVRAGGFALLAALAYFLWPMAKSGVLALFSRVRTDKLLENSVRAALHHAVETEPGIHHQDLVRRVGRSNGTVEHHLAKLIDSGLVARVQGAGYTCYFLKGAADRRDMAVAPLLKSPVAQAVLAAARNRPGILPSMLADELKVTRPTISYHLRRLEAAGLVVTRNGVWARP